MEKALFIIGLLAPTRALALEPDPVQPHELAIPANTSGQFYLNLRIDGTPITALVDTGASLVVLTAEDAEKVGIDVKNPRFTTSTNTAAGAAPRALLWLKEIDVGGIVLRNVRASCCAGGGKSLLGMTALSRLDVKISNGVMHLSPANP